MNYTAWPSYCAVCLVNDRGYEVQSLNILQIMQFWYSRSFCLLNTVHSPYAICSLRVHYQSPLCLYTSWKEAIRLSIACNLFKVLFLSFKLTALLLANHAVTWNVFICVMLDVIQLEKMKKTTALCSRISCKIC